MNDFLKTSANDPLNDTYPVAAWTWHDSKGGLLSTQIYSTGQIRQIRQYDQDDAATPQNLGMIPASQAAALLGRCRDALRMEVSSRAASSQATPGGETYQLALSESETQTSSRQIARAALNSHSALEAIRREVLGARKQVGRRWNIWRSAGARWFYLTVAVTLALGLYIALDMKHDDQLQARAQKLTGTVTQRGGIPYKTEFLTVRLNSDAAPEVNIANYLSHPNWEAAKPGSQVDVLYDPQSGQAWLAADLLRWQGDKKTIWVLPGFLLLMAFIGLAWLRRYEIGVYDDGQEYMIQEDRVVTDDKDALISRSTLLWFKMFMR